MMMYKKRMAQKIAIAFIALFVLDIAFPTMALALTSGPSQPEFSSFEPVATTNMVNEFTGDFTYNLPVLNIPGPEGGGYAMSLSYHSGTSMEEEASWVGNGWTLNPGSVMRSKVGVPDDWKGKNKITYNKNVPNKTATLGLSSPLEIYSSDALNITGAASIRYNNFRGFGYSANFKLSLFDGVASLGMHVDNGNTSFSPHVSPSAISHKIKENSKKIKAEIKAEIKKTEDEQGFEISDDQREQITEKAQANSRGVDVLSSIVSSSYGLYSMSMRGQVNNSPQYSGESIKVDGSFLVALTSAEAGIEPELFGSYSVVNNEEEIAQSNYGYLYSQDALSSDYTRMDYNIERPSGYDKHDKVLPIPYASKDNFGMTGEAIGGGFKLFSSQIGHFRPAKSVSSIKNVGFGTSADVGGASGGGPTMNFGESTTKVQAWGTPNSFSRKAELTDSEMFLRFSNDKGGELTYGDSQDFFQEEHGIVANFGKVSTQHLSQNLTSNEGRRRSSMVSYNLNKDIIEVGNLYSDTERSFPYSYSKDPDINYNSDITAGQDGHVDREHSSITDQIGEVSVVNETGMRYTYGLPTYSFKEENIQVGIRDGLSYGYEGNSIVTRPSIYNAEGYNTDELKTLMGEESETPYATSWLLTDITTPDYIDRTLDGPSQDDFGGYTKFKYEKYAGIDWSNSEEEILADDVGYRWRSPYRGFRYARNSFSDPKDDLIGFSSGQKEIYYLSEIETKTHKAVFITSDQRFDARSAEPKGDAGEKLSNDDNLGPTDGLKKLDRIELYKIDEDGNRQELLQTIHFRYDYSTWNNVPNYYDSNNQNANGGKLTLKHVWMEYNGVVDAKISPYTFNYEYPDFSSLYAGLGEEDYGQRFSAPYSTYSTSEENPDYNVLDVDAWGNYQKNGENRSLQYENWSDQLLKDTEFDPAVYQLKQIILPSGGEIHIQYESDDYAYVQDKPVHMLAQLSNTEPHLDPLGMPVACDPASSIDVAQTPTYFIDANSLPDYVNLDDADEKSNYLNRMVKAINDYYQDTDNKLFFKFFYKLQNSGTPYLTDCNADYIEGYSDLYEASVFGESIMVRLTANIKNYPRKLCKDFVKSNRAGMINDGAGCDPSDPGPFESEDPVDVLSQLKSLATSFDPCNSCKQFNPEHSYLRIPMITPKRGGGIRVKRLLMYEPGISRDSEQVSQKALYGQEYIYKTIKNIDGKEEFISSGVATNEPPGNRNENPLVTFMPRFKQSYADRVIGGRDRKQMEGPIGENALPSPSVGYSKIISKNIHNGKTHTGYTISEYYTAKDYPLKGRPSELSKKQTPISLAAAVGVSHFDVKLAQGFIIEKNAMHGQMKSNSAFSSKADQYEESLDKDWGVEFASNEEVLVSNTTYEYFEPGEMIPVSTGPLSELEDKHLGVEMDIAMESKFIKDFNSNTTIDAEGGVQMFGVPIPWLSGAPTYTASSTQLKTFTNSKVVYYPSIVKKVTQKQEGIQHVTENLAFDSNTGEPVITRSYDDFSHEAGLYNPSTINHDYNYTSYQFPASSVYKEMGQKSINEQSFILKNNGLDDLNIAFNSANSLLVSSSSTEANTCDVTNLLSEGDLIIAVDENNVNSYGLTDTPENIYHINAINGDEINLSPVSYCSNYNIGTGTDIDLYVMRSGRTNQLRLPAGSITTYGSLSDIQAAAIPPPDIAQRQAFVNALNTHFSGDLSQTSQFEYNQDLEVFHQGECVSINSELPIVGEVNNNTFDLYVQDFQTYSGTNDYLWEYLAEIVNLGQEEVLTYQLDAANLLENTDNTICQGIPFTNSGTAFELGKYHHFGSNEALADWSGKLRIFPSCIQNEIPVDCGELSYNILSDFVDAVGNGGQNNKSVKINLSTGELINQEFVVQILEGDQYLMLKRDCDPLNPNQTHMYFGFIENYDPASNDDYLDQLTKVQELPSGRYLDFYNEPGQNGLYVNFQSLGSSSIETLPVFEIESTCTWTAGGCSTPLCSIDLDNYISTDGETGEVMLNGTFNLDPVGEMYFDPSIHNCDDVSMNCMSFCSDGEPGQNIIKDVVAASFTTFDDEWNYDIDAFWASSSDISERNAYELGSKGKWRPSSSYTYESELGLLNQYAGLDEKNYNSGVFELPMFDWNNPPYTGTNWKRVSDVMAYDPHGNAIEEQNVLGIKSCAKYGYHHNVPYLVASNSDYASALFEGFENQYGNQFEDGLIIHSSFGTQSNSEAHSGEYSLELNTGASQVLLTPGPLSDIVDQGLLAKVWLKTDRVDRESIASSIKLNIGDEYFQFSEVARSGDWALYECMINPEDIQINEDISLLYVKDNVAENVWLDDLRMQPLESQLITYVYDNSLRLIAQFDDQNFGLFYQYNGEGKLVRKLKETVRGTKTITETQYNTVTINRNEID